MKLNILVDINVFKGFWLKTHLMDQMCGQCSRSNASRSSKLGVKHNLFWPKMMENGLVKVGNSDG